MKVKVMRSNPGYLLKSSLPYVDSAQDSDLAHLFGDLNPRQKNFQRLSHLWVSFRSKMTVRTTKLFWLFAFSVRVRFPELAQSDHDVTDAGFEY